MLRSGKDKNLDYGRDKTFRSLTYKSKYSMSKFPQNDSGQNSVVGLEGSV